MSVNRREFLQMLSIGASAGIVASCSKKISTDSPYSKKIKKNSSVRLLHITDVHAQLQPIYFREPSVNIGVHSTKNNPPHVVGENFLDYYNMEKNTPDSYAYTYLNFSNDAKKYGKVGGFAHLKTLIDSLTGEFGDTKTLLMDGGDTWQGSGTALWTQGQDMVKACNLLGVDVMTGHWEFTYEEEVVRKNIKDFNGEFIAQNISLTEDAAFDEVESYDENTGHAFKPYTIKKLGGHRIAVIGQAFPYTPIANPKRFVKNWTFGIKTEALQKTVDLIKSKEKPDAIVLLSHNGMDVDLKLASIINGIDIVFGGHTHDGIPKPIKVKNPSGVTFVTNAGSNGKFVGCMDLVIKDGKLVDFDYSLFPIFSNLLKEDAEMSSLIADIRKPYLSKLNQKLAVAEDLLYRRGNFNGTFDQVICDALTEVKGADISFSGGFRWGTTVLPGEDITMERVLDQTAITYPNTYVKEMSGAVIKNILEDVADNVFNKDPFYQQGGDMVRVGGLDYECHPLNNKGSRISNMRLNNGKSIEANKSYKVAGWGAVNSIPDGKPVWDVVAEYLLSKKSIKITKYNHPKVSGLKNNMGIAE